MIKGIILSLVLLLTFVSKVSAHGDGASLEKDVDGYLVDVGYDPDTLVSQEVVVLDFSLIESESQTPVEFSDVWVKISSADEVVFATSINKARIGLTTLTYAFPDEGEYVLSARYQSGNDTLVETEFPLRVSASAEVGEDKIPESGNSSGNNSIVYLGAGTILGLIMGFGLVRLISKK
jgi:hypothetical protein